MNPHPIQNGPKLQLGNGISNWQPSLEAVRAALTRRQFLGRTILAGAGLLTGSAGCSQLKHQQSASNRISFVTANLVGQVSGYRFELAHWGDQHKKTVAATDAAAWRSICKQIYATGFRAIEIWEAHAAPEAMSRERGATWKAIMDDQGLKAIGYGGKM